MLDAQPLRLAVNDLAGRSVKISPLAGSHLAGLAKLKAFFEGVATFAHFAALHSWPIASIVPCIERDEVELVAADGVTARQLAACVAETVQRMNAALAAMRAARTQTV